jgi:hypothetical protein
MSNIHHHNLIALINYLLNFIITLKNKKNLGATSRIGSGFRQESLPGHLLPGRVGPSYETQ